MAELMEKNLKDDSISWKKPEKDAIKSDQIRREGNNKFLAKNRNWKTHSSALSLYNQSAALAPQDSEEMALAYGNRSALLLYLAKYDECLIDIEKAYQITKSDSLKEKLTARKKNCLAQKTKIKNLPKNEPIPLISRMKASETIPCASAFLSIKFDDKNGRHIIASQDIEAGTVIVIEKGFATFPNSSCMYMYCTHCLKVAYNGIPCDSCSTTIFCSEKCQKEAWSEYHDLDCSVIHYFNSINTEVGDLYEILIRYAKLAIRVFIKAVKKEGLKSVIKDALDIEKKKESIEGFYDDNGIFQSNNFKSIYNLSTMDLSFEIENKLTTTVDFMFTRNFFQNTSIESLDSVKKILLKLFRITNLNSFTIECTSFSTSSRIVKKQENKVGVIIVPFCSLFNHSCWNNTERLFTSNNEVVFFTKTFIKKGEQLSVNYGFGILTSKLERQARLKINYGFTCTCPMCEENWQMNTCLKRGCSPITMQKLFAEFGKLGIKQSSMITIDQANSNNYTEDILRDAKKMARAVRKCSFGVERFMNSESHVEYITEFFEHFYLKKNDIPDTC